MAEVRRQRGLIGDGWSAAGNLLPMSVFSALNPWVPAPERRLGLAAPTMSHLCRPIAVLGGFGRTRAPLSTP